MYGYNCRYMYIHKNLHIYIYIMYIYIYMNIICINIDIYIYTLYIYICMYVCVWYMLWKCLARTWVVPVLVHSSLKLNQNGSTSNLRQLCDCVTYGTLLSAKITKLGGLAYTCIPYNPSLYTVLKERAPKNTGRQGHPLCCFASLKCTAFGGPPRAWEKLRKHQTDSKKQM